MKKVLILLTAAILCMKIAGAAQADEYPMFDFDRKTVTLNSGYEMPILGLGMFNLSDSEAENSTYWALKAGFRLIDTARIYGNEKKPVIAEAGAFLPGEHAGFITGTDLLIDGGTIAAIRTGQYKLGR